MAVSPGKVRRFKPRGRRSDRDDLQTMGRELRVVNRKEEIVSAIFPVGDVNGLDSKMHGHFGRAPYFVIDQKMHIGVKLARIIISYKIDLLFTSAIGEISFHMLKDNFVDIFKVEKGLSVKKDHRTLPP